MWIPDVVDDCNEYLIQTDWRLNEFATIFIRLSNRIPTIRSIFQCNQARCWYLAVRLKTSIHSPFIADTCPCSDPTAFFNRMKKKNHKSFLLDFFQTSIATDMHIIVRNVWWNRNGFPLNACIAWEKKTSMVSKHLWSISVVHQHLMANKIVKQCWLNSSEDWTVTNTNNNYFKLFMIRNLPNESSPLFSMLNLIVLGIETRLVVALSVFFFFGFSKSA